MTDNDRKIPRPAGQEQRDHDPLLELTRLFDLDRSNGEIDVASDRLPPLADNQPPENAYHAERDDFDLSFLESELETSLADDLSFDDPLPNAAETARDTGALDFLTQEPTSSEVDSGEADLPFNELYDMPSFSPQARSPGSLIETPAGFDETVANSRPYQPNEDETVPEASQQESFESEPFLFDETFDLDDIPAPALSSSSGAERNPFDSRSTVTAEPTTGWTNSTEQNGNLQSAPIFDESDFDTELENLLTADPIPLDDALSDTATDTTPSYGAGDQFATDETLSADLMDEIDPWPQETIAGSPPSSEFSNSQTDWSVYDTEQPTAPFAHEPPQDSQNLNLTLSDDDPFGFDNVFAENSARTNSQPLAHEGLDTTRQDPFGLEDLSEEEQLISTSLTNYEAYDLQGAEDVDLLAQSEESPFQQEVPAGYIEDNQPLTENTDYQMADDTAQTYYEPNYPNSNVDDGNLPPEVDTYKFADEIVEATETFDLPEIAYQEEPTTANVDTLETEFADVFSVGNRIDERSDQDDQNAFFEDAYANSGYENPNASYNADSNLAVNADQYDQEQPYGTYSGDTSYDMSTDAAMLGASTIASKRTFIRKASFGGAALLILLGVGFAASKFFMPSANEGDSTVIHADDAPFKVQAEATDNQNSAANNQDVYNHASGSEASAQGTQDTLVDKSETPEDLTALNEQAPQSVDPYVDPSNVEDAIAAASNQTVPMREVQTVVVNPDGTIVPVPSQTSATSGPAGTQAQSSAGVAPTTTQQDNIAAIVNDSPESIDSANTESSATPQQTKAQVQNNTPAPTATSTTPPAPTPTNQQTMTTAVGNGGYYVQIASQPTQELAQTSMTKAKSQFGSIIGTLPLNIQSAAIPGKGTYYRVRVQVGPRDNAVSLCDRIKKANGNCFVGR
ncbi:SPOR domain-containing protein [Bartonella sp. LJL80]